MYAQALAVPSNVVVFRRPPPMSERDSSDGGSIRQQIGDTLATVRFLVETLKDIRAERKDFEERIWMELRTIKHDSNGDAQLVSARLELADRRSGEMERRLGEVEATMKGIATEIVSLKRPVEAIIEIRKWMKWLVGIIGSAILLLAAFGRAWYDNWVSSFWPHK